MNSTIEKLLDAAIDARGRAWAPYSKFRVGAALITAGGDLFTGSNVENSSYGMTVCAERIAMFKAVNEGHREFTQLLVVTDTPEPAPPCGACLQVMMEFAPQLQVHLANLKGKVITYRLAELLPVGFNPSWLNQ